jgi:hypothetical protein
MAGLGFPPANPTFWRCHQRGTGGRYGANPPVPVVAIVGYVRSRTIKYLDLVRADGTGGCPRTDAR